MSDGSQATNAAFVRLAGIHTLNMSLCSQATVTDAAFAHLHGIRTLVIGDAPVPFSAVGLGAVLFHDVH